MKQHGLDVMLARSDGARKGYWVRGHEGGGGVDDSKITYCFSNKNVHAELLGPGIHT
jgi:hypothetical protein